MQIDHPEQKHLMPYPFFGTDEAKEYFSEVYNQLSEGMHIQSDQGRLFQFIADHDRDLRQFFLDFNRDSLEKGLHAGESFYFLSRLETYRGKSFRSKRHQDLDGYHLVFALILVNMFVNEKSFSLTKKIRWSEIEAKIRDGEFSAILKRIFIKKVRTGYTQKDWNRVKKAFRRSLLRYKRYGWVKRFKAKDRDDIVFVLRASFHRVVLLYQDLIENPEKFITEYSMGAEA